MTSSREKVGGLFVNSFELVGYLEDLDCSVDTGSERGNRVWRWDYHVLKLDVEVSESVCEDLSESDADLKRLTECEIVILQLCARVILEGASARQGCDMIVMPLHGHRGVSSRYSNFRNETKRNECSRLRFDLT